MNPRAFACVMSTGTQENNTCPSVLIFGAGKIGRSFIGQLFGLSGYEVVFSDIDLSLVQMLNRRRTYPVIIKDEVEECLQIPNVRAVSGLDKEQVVKEVAGTSLMAVSVGKNALEKIIPFIAEGLMLRFRKDPANPLNVIIAENMRSAALFMHQKLKENLPSTYPLDRLVGLVETSIGKMVPIMTREDLKEDPLQVFAEAYNSLIIDKQAFKGLIPAVRGLCPKENIQAWVDRKAFIHNLGHATVAYYGAFKHPEAICIYEVLDDAGVLLFAREVMLQAAAIIQKQYPNDFSMEELEGHIDDLLKRFRNKHLKDTIYRVGQDRPRKLGPDDRFVGIIRMAERLGMDNQKIIEAMTCSFLFKATDENGNRSEPDILFDGYLSEGIEYTLQKICGFDQVKDKTLINKCLQCYSGVPNIPAGISARSRIVSNL